MADHVKFTPKELPYGYDALQPAMSEETLRFHHDKHYTGYVNKLNELVEGTPYAQKSLEEIIMSAEGVLFNQAAQAWNHEFFFDQFSATPAAAPEGPLAEAIARDFGSVGELVEGLNRAAAGLFGSGWAWLVEDKEGALALVNEPNAGNPMCRGMRPLLCLDVWEHAYYIDYRNRRPDALAAWWSRLDWKVIERRYGKK